MPRLFLMIFLIFIGLILYLLLGHHFNIYIFCLFKKLTGLYCPGCGITRMLYSIVNLKFYQAFRYNPLLFIMLPFGIFFYIDYLIRKDKSIYKKIPSKFWYLVIIILIIYGILRNISEFSFLAPTDI